MKAILRERYGPPEVLQLREVEKPIPKDDEVVVEVHAASLNALDWHRMRGSPFLMRLLEGLRKPKRPELGSDFAGVVESLGRNATEFHPGDAVFGRADGAFGEYVSATETDIVLKPSNVSYELAAAVPIAALTALQALRDKGQIQPGQRVLVNGAGGGVGTFAVQLAKHFGAEVTAVSSAGNLDLLRSIGADHVMDYSRDDFTKNGARYDLIVDAYPTRSVSAYKRVLNSEGICVVVGFGGMTRLISLGLRAKFASKAQHKRVLFMGTKPTKGDLGVLKELLESGKLVPVIDRRYTLDEVPGALAYLEGGHARGKVIINVAPAGSAL